MIMKNLLFCVCSFILFSWQVSAQTVTSEQFFYAARYGDINVFIKNGNIFNVDVSDTDTQGNTLLHYAADHDHLEVARILMLVGADPHLENDQGKTPAQLAADTRDRYRGFFCSYVTNCSDYIDNVGDTRNQRIEEYDAEVWFNAHQEQVAIVNLLNSFEQQPVSPDPSLLYPGMTDIELALTVWVRDPFRIIAADTEYPEHILQIFIERIANDASIDFTARRYGANLLHYAVSSARMEVIEALIERGMDFNEPSSRGRSPLDIVSRIKDQYKRRICNVTEVSDDRLCTDEYMNRFELTPFQSINWGSQVRVWHSDYLKYYEVVQLLESYGAESAEP